MNPYRRLEHPSWSWARGQHVQGRGWGVGGGEAKWHLSLLILQADPCRSTRHHRYHRPSPAVTGNSAMTFSQLSPQLRALSLECYLLLQVVSWRPSVSLPRSQVCWCDGWWGGVTKGRAAGRHSDRQSPGSQQSLGWVTVRLPVFVRLCFARGSQLRRGPTCRLTCVCHSKDTTTLAHVRGFREMVAGFLQHSARQESLSPSQLYADNWRRACFHIGDRRIIGVRLSLSLCLLVCIFCSELGWLWLSPIYDAVLFLQGLI